MFSWCSSLNRLPTRLQVAFPLSFTIFSKDLKDKRLLLGENERRTRREKGERKGKRLERERQQNGKVLFFSKIKRLTPFSFFFYNKIMESVGQVHVAHKTSPNIF